MPVRTQQEQMRARSMQRVPTVHHRSIPETAGGAIPHEAPSPLVALARRIREEQGVEGLKEFIAAMTPFAAPNELRNMASSFGVDYDGIMAQKSPAYRAGEHEHGERRTGGNMGTMGNMGGMMPLMQLMRMLPMLQGMMRGGGDMSALFKMMGGA